MTKLDDVIARRRVAVDAFDAYNAHPDRVTLFRQIKALEREIEPLQDALADLLEQYHDARYEELDRARLYLVDGVVECEGRVETRCSAVAALPRGFDRAIWTCPECR